jgi:ABC-type protease/lipase transport system fused ATPase/permease subunit
MDKDFDFLRIAVASVGATCFQDVPYGPIYVPDF